MIIRTENKNILNIFEISFYNESLLMIYPYVILILMLNSLVFIKSIYIYGIQHLVSYLLKGDVLMIVVSSSQR